MHSFSVKQQTSERNLQWKTFYLMFYLRSGRSLVTSTSSPSSPTSPRLRRRGWSCRRSLTGYWVSPRVPSPARRCWTGWGGTLRPPTLTPSWGWSCRVRRGQPRGLSSCQTRSIQPGQTRLGEKWCHLIISVSRLSSCFSSSSTGSTSSGISSDLHSLVSPEPDSKSSSSSSIKPQLPPKRRLSLKMEEKFNDEDNNSDTGLSSLNSTAEDQYQLDTLV